MVLQVPSIKTKPVVTWEPLPANFVLPDDPVENIQQPALAAALTDALGAAGYIQPEMLIATNLGLVATVNKKTVVKAPDWLYVPQVHPVAEGIVRRSYTPHTEGAAVAIVMEFLSDEDGAELSIRSTPPYGKLHFYEQILQVPTYVTYDPYDGNLEVRYRQNGRYTLELANAEGRVWIPELELYLGLWAGQRLGQTMNWLRWWDRAGNLLLWSSEQVEQERQRAEQESQRAEQERQRAEQESQRAEQESQRAEILAAKLRALGIDPDLPD
jgi:Uma2 family endonuclease